MIFNLIDHRIFDVINTVLIPVAIYFLIFFCIWYSIIPVQESENEVPNELCFIGIFILLFEKNILNFATGDSQIQGKGLFAKEYIPITKRK